MKRIAIVLLALGCGEKATESTTASAAADKPDKPSATATAATSSPALSASASGSASWSPEKFALKTAIDFMGQIEGKATDLKMTDIKRYTESDDPNKLLGRPNQYLIKFGWKVAGNDATIEVFGTSEDAAARAEYIRNIGKATPLLLQYVYLNEKRRAVLRVPKELTPSEAKVWEGFLAAL